ncbi:MAG: pyrroloquinoline quinone-dependent dehydrogenase [Pseudomonadota bacterium]|nr:pyrroloquinoline quinone-dependent dehydrogenase [Pseudomonadota bacterium]
MHKSIVIAVLGILASACSSSRVSPDWPTYHHDAGGSRFSPLKQITPANVATLQPAWTYHMRPQNSAPQAPSDAGDAPPTRPARFSPSQATPLVVNGRMFLSTPYGRVVALDADNGRELWVYELPNYDQASTRGVEYWPGMGGAEPAIFFGTRSGKLIALSAASGQPIATFGQNGSVDMKTPEVMNGQPRAPLGMSSPPLTYKNLVITGSRVQETPTQGAAGDVRAWDARTGRLVWTFHTVPRPGEPGHDTWEGDSWKNRSGVNVWTSLVLDDARGIVYLPLGAPSFDRWGGDRKGANLFGNSIVALEAATGKYLWHFQTVHHDIWDLDLPAATLLDVKQAGRTIPAIAVMNKTALVFLLDRVTGEPLYEVKEVPVPTDTDIPDEVPWPTQPMPVAPAPLARLDFDMADLATLTPEHRAFCERLIEEKNIVESRMYQPLRGDSAVASFPGSLGGIDWGGGAFDPQLGYFIVNTNDLASPQQLAKRPDGSWGLKDGYVYFWNPETRLPCQQPPWGRLQAVDVNTGNIAWRSTLGISDNLPEGLQNTGRISAGGPILTAGGLAFIGATDDRRIRAFDSRTGAELWTFKLPASIYGTPSTYQGKSGKQFVVAVSTGGFAGSPVESDVVTAFSLPAKL